MSIECPKCGSPTRVPFTLKLKTSVIRKRKCMNEACQYMAQTVERWQSVDDDRSIERIERVVTETIKEQAQTLFSNR